MNNQFSENLKKIRKEHNLSQEQLADELGVSRQAISKWESGSAYPEMDKIIALCDKFNLNIDDLLHKDIKEVKGEDETKKNINNLIDSFLNFVTDTINLFSSMNFKSKIKCIFEQIVIGTILFLCSLIIIAILNSLVGSILKFLPGNIEIFMSNIFDSLLYTLCTVGSVIILAHIFKTRYLDYYDKIKTDTKIEENDTKENNNEKDIDKENKIMFKNNENKIVIRDPKHSEYRFINGIFKLFIGIIKFFLLCIAFSVSITLICLFVAIAVSFLICKTGIFFIGILLALLAASTIAAIILVLILNFVFNRKSNKKMMIWGFVLSLAIFGLGCGLVFSGSLNFEIVNENDEALKTVKTEHIMKDDLKIYSDDDTPIEYIESDINNVVIEYSLSEACDLKEFVGHYGEIVPSGECYNVTGYIKKFVKNVNDYKIILMDGDIKNITVYANKNNIEKIKNNIKKEFIFDD